MQSNALQSVILQYADTIITIIWLTETSLRELTDEINCRFATTQRIKSKTLIEFPLFFPLPRLSSFKKRVLEIRRSELSPAINPVARHSFHYRFPRDPPCWKTRQVSVAEVATVCRG